MNLADLQIVGAALEVATELQAKWPVVFTSGRRGIADQSRAMAQNIIQGGAGWLSATYAPSMARGACILAVQNLTTPLNYEAVEAAIYSVLSALTGADLAHLSRHLSGCAFDCDPKTVSEAARVWLDYECRVRGGKLLTCEGNLLRVHCEFPLP